MQYRGYSPYRGTRDNNKRRPAPWRLQTLTQHVGLRDEPSRVPIIAGGGFSVCPCHQPQPEGNHFAMRNRCAELLLWAGAMGLRVRLTTPLSLLLLAMDLRTAGLVAAKCIVAIQQNPLVVEEPANNVTIACNFTANHCSGQPQLTWYSIHGDRSRKLCVGECPDEEDAGRFRLQGPVGKGMANLRIRQVTGEDSGVYVCTVAYENSPSLTGRQAGNGTTLKVTDHGGINLWLQSILIAVLSIYALCITINLLQTLKPNRKVDLQHRNCSSLVEESGSLALQAIAHELHSKFQKGSHSSLSPPQQHTAGPVDESIYQNV